MSSPPFGEPLYSHDDISFLEETPNYAIQNPPFVEETQMTTDDMPSSIPSMSEFEDLGMLFVEDVEEDNPLLIEQLYSSNINDETQLTDIIEWVAQSEQVGFEEVAAVKQVAQGSIQPLHDHDYAGTTTTTTRMIDEEEADVKTGEGSSSKKEDHNAKERVRRMRLNATFLALRSLLPDSRRPKKRWSGPYVIDRALEYIPQLQSRIDKLTLEKDNMVSVIEKRQLQLPLIATSTDDDQHVLINQVDNCATLTVSINEVKEGEVIIQICQHKDKADVLTTLFDKFEGEGMQIVGASSLCASEDRTCFHIHIQMSEKPRESDYVAILHQKIISWLS